MRSQTILAALEGESMQDPASELRRINLLRTWVNKGKRGRSLTIHRQFIALSYDHSN